MIGTKFTLTNKDGESIIINDHVTNPSQIIALQSYPNMEVNIKNRDIDKEGQHGMYEFTSYYGSRLVNFQGVIIGDTIADVEAVRQKLIKVLQLPVQPTSTRDGVVTVKWTDNASESWQVEARLARDVSFSRPMRRPLQLDFNLSMKSVDPFIVGQTANNLFGIRGYVQSGAQIPIGLPATIGTIQQGVMNPVNNGAVYAHTTLRLYGESQQEITSPRVVSLTTGDICEIDTTLADETEYVEIDSKTGSITNQDGTDLSGFLTAESTFILLATGANQLMYLSDEDPTSTLLAPTAQWTLSSRNTRI